MKDSCLNEIQKYRDGNGYLLAFSGGGDSVYLLLCLHEVFQEDLSKYIQLAYVDYHDSPYVDNEEDVIYHYANKFHLKLHKVDTQFEKEIHKNFEDWARKFRYKFFQEICQKEGLNGVFCAHHLSDSVETYLLQKERNNLPLHYGLKEESIVKGVRVLRPMLSITKREMAAYLDENHIYYYDDPTNHDDHTKRNKIRKSLSDEDIYRISKEIDEQNRLLQELYEQFDQHPKGLSFPLYNGLSEEEKMRYIFFLLSSSRSKRMEGLAKDLREFLKKKGRGIFCVNKDTYIYRDQKGFFLSKDIHQLSYSYTLDKAKPYSFPQFDIDLTDISKFNLKKLPVTIRSYQEGDQISTDLPTKDVKKFLQKQGVPYYLIPIYPVFLSDDKIQCVPFYKDIMKKKIPMKLKLIER